MISRARLDKVTTIVTHADCPDGVASALLLRDAFTDARVVFVKHGTDAFEQLQPQFGMLFCDIVPPRARAREFFEAGAIVLDHHEKQRDVVELFGPLGVYSDEPGVSGAMLAFREVWAHTSDPEARAYQRAHDFAALAGVRDTWQTAHPDWVRACAQAEALRFYPWHHFTRLTSPFDKEAVQLAQMLDTGYVLLDRRALQVRRAVAESARFRTQRGTRVMVVPTIETSDVAEAAGDAADVVVGFKYFVGGEDGNADQDAKLVVSTRSRTGYDVGEFCRTLGGGGHRAAAGATLRVLPYDAQPYAVVEKLFADYERGLPPAAP